ncbi:PFU-domain-containing protein [Metschnikowia bicuspidata var. bicuspidata NRRL YB-4993]|uniref:PFU-domain-containing protein n=1 Tax=Metschnikowia bicuspidata var. bicuspidata NRRL YB-4993 TaxID=869754 RepID=A0A1A0H730_9ASCO|nr:PFU-domain-containing protein [Metschnikowia bicuspidata var. bicuspidata NRRL YB-4993]OBA19841.1 PFU-domain-containing protein [Metschnikowia bicuspidata var. bicuspidata NRRL YB-4993]
MYQLRSILHGHELDVRGITALSLDVLVSGSRDGTARRWQMDMPLDKNHENIICFLSPTGSFINSVESVCCESTGPVVACGGNDAVIYLSESHESFAKPGDDFGKFQLPGHLGNVCSLHALGGLLISGSWDCTAKVWDLNLFSVKHDLVGHQASVWDAKIVDPAQETYLTCSADRTIRMWHRGSQTASFTGHADVVRKLLVFPGGKQFASASNDCTIKIWDLASGRVLQTLEGHNSFIYDLAMLSNGDLVSTAEDRTVRIWRNGAVLQAITLPCISVWCVAVLPNDDIAVGGSDKQIYVFTAEQTRMATAQGIKAFADLVQLSAISEQSIDDLKKTDIPGYDRLNSPGKEEGATVMVKSPAGVIEAHQWSGGQWVKIGDVVSSAGASSGKVEYQGAEYDYVFDVDVEDGKPPLKLPFNCTENPYIAAERFLAANDLPGSYTEEVVKFINQNTAGMSLDLQPASGAGPVENLYPNPTTNQAPTQHSSRFFPQKLPIVFTDFKPEQLVRGFSKLNSEQPAGLAFSHSIVARVQSTLIDLKSKDALYLITDVIPVILENWSKSQRLIGFDFLRISIAKITTVDLLQSTEAAENVFHLLTRSLEEVLDEDVTLFMMMSRFLSNLTTGTLFTQIFLTVGDDGSVVFNEYFDDLTQNLTVIVKVLTSSSVAGAHKHFKMAISSIASFFFDVLVYILLNKSIKSSPSSWKTLLAVLEDIGEDLVQADEEAAYRLAVTYGNLLVLGGSISNPKWYEMARNKYSLARFTDVQTEIAKLV